MKKLNYEEDQTPCQPEEVQLEGFEHEEFQILGFSGDIEGPDGSVVHFRADTADAVFAAVDFFRALAREGHRPAECSDVRVVVNEQNNSAVPYQYKLPIPPVYIETPSTLPDSWPTVE